MTHSTRRISVSQEIAGVLFLIVFAALGAGGYMGYMYVTELSKSVGDLRSELAFTTEQLEARIHASHTLLLAEINEEQENVSSLAENIGTLEKLSKTDPELLQKYSKVFFLNEHYKPERIVEIPEEYTYDEDRTYQIHAGVWPHLEDLLKRAKRDNIELYVFSAFRSFDEQNAIKGNYTVTYGAGTANTFSADQGYSEHQLGTTVDFITTGIDGSLEGFETTKAYEWLRDNAHRYGFTLSYPPSNSYYVFEPWHWRFVGEDLAIDLHNDNEYFYDRDQREIDEYLISIFD